MTDFSKVIENLKQRGYEVLIFKNVEEAAEYLNCLLYTSRSYTRNGQLKAKTAG